MTSKFRLIALLEGVSFPILLVCSVVKRTLGDPDLVPVMGLVHGVLFLAYVVMALAVREEQGWTVGQTLLVLIASAVPFGAFVVHKRMVHDPAAATA